MTPALFPFLAAAAGAGLILTLLLVLRLRKGQADLEVRLAVAALTASRVPDLEEAVRSAQARLEGERKALQERIEALIAAKGQGETALAETREGLTGALELLGDFKARLETAQAERKALQERLEGLMGEAADKAAARARLEETLDQERRQAEGKLALMAEAKEGLSLAFKVVAEEIMSRHGATFTKQNKDQLDGVLTPLKEKLAEFGQDLKAVHTESVKDRATLAEQIRSLTETSASMSMETRNLTQALKGKAQVQGAWGEMILATILERSGLREGEEYVAQESHTAEDGSRLRPDVIVKLPGSERIVIDSKVSLKAFEEFINGATGEDRAAALKRHLASIRTHIRTLGGKDYQLATGSGLDYVLMFIPIEGALATALLEDPGITAFAAECNVAIATPTTLMIALRTVANVWKVERRNVNAEAIARRAGQLYDKFFGFITDMERIRIHLNHTSDAYEHAMLKLTKGRGNLLTQADQLKALGARTAKSLPESLKEEPEDADHGEPAGPAEG